MYWFGQQQVDVADYTMALPATSDSRLPRPGLCLVVWTLVIE